MALTLFQKFCEYVDGTIFSKENVGDTLAFIVDQAFIDDFCKVAGVIEEELLREIRRVLDSHDSLNDILSIKGIIAIQLYAATKREDSGEITERNYRDRLSQLLNWSLPDLQAWMQKNQEKFWRALYSWCDRNDFKIDKCEVRDGVGRYVQFPVQQAARAFTQEDLKHIAYYFFTNNIQPGEDISEKDFWRILSKRKLTTYISTSHGRQLIGNPEYAQDAPRQIYNYYLRWDGSYMAPYSGKTKREEAEKLFLYLKADFSVIDVRDEGMNLKTRIEINNTLSTSLKPYYRFKRPCCIIFRRNDIYDGYWEETRYLEKEEEGLALIINEPASTIASVTYYKQFKEFRNSEPIHSSGKIKIYRFVYSDLLADYFSLGKPFSLEGGLKIGRMQFLLGGAPMLHLLTDTPFYIDGERQDTKPKNGFVNLNYLSAGRHSVKVPNSRKVEFEIFGPEPHPVDWDSSYNKWIFGRRKGSWSSDRCEEGIVGLDFSSIMMAAKNDGHSEPEITRWARFHLTGRTTDNENNIAIKILSR